jgi:hypothetical protein
VRTALTSCQGYVAKHATIGKPAELTVWLSFVDSFEYARQLKPGWEGRFFHIPIAGDHPRCCEEIVPFNPSSDSYAIRFYDLGALHASPAAEMGAAFYGVFRRESHNNLDR